MGVCSFWEDELKMHGLGDFQATLRWVINRSQPSDRCSVQGCDCNYPCDRLVWYRVRGFLETDNPSNLPEDCFCPLGGSAVVFSAHCQESRGRVVDPREKCSNQHCLTTSRWYYDLGSKVSNWYKEDHLSSSFQEETQASPLSVSWRTLRYGRYIDLLWWPKKYLHTLDGREFVMNRGSQ